jgi:hypothetical protein
MLHFLAGRAIAGIEVVQNGEYMRTVHVVNTDGGNSGSMAAVAQLCDH